MRKAMLCGPAVVCVFLAGLVVEPLAASGLAYNPETGLLLVLHGLARNPGDGALYASSAADALPSTLYRIDSSTGAATPIGPIGFFDVSALDFDPTTGILYGAAGGPFPAGALITIDVLTGAGTLVGNTRRINGLSLIGAMDAGVATLCHRPPGSPGNAQTITIDAAAVPAHLEHGDALEACPISAALSIDRVKADPAVFFMENAADLPGDDSVLVDVMLRMGTAQEIDGYSLEVHFDPAMVQVTQAEGSVTPFGACNAFNPTCLLPSPICFDNLAFGNANATGTLLAGVSVLGPCPTYNASAEVKLLTLRFTATTTGQSRIALISGPNSGDCEVYNNALNLGIPCLDGDATISAAQ